MTTFLSFVGVAAVIYHTGGSLLRYWYVKASLRPEVAEVSYDFFGSQYVQRYTSQLIMYVLYTEIGHSVRLRV